MTYRGRATQIFAGPRFLGRNLNNIKILGVKFGTYPMFLDHSEIKDNSRFVLGKILNRKINFKPY